MFNTEPRDERFVDFLVWVISHIIQLEVLTPYCRDGDEGVPYPTIMTPILFHTGCRDVILEFVKLANLMIY